MISKAQIKFITSLKEKKYRDKNRLFIAEGPKIIKDLLQRNVKCKGIYGISDQQDDFLKFDVPYTYIDAKTLHKLSSFKTPNKMLAVFDCFKPNTQIHSDNPIVILEDISDPGNLGTIIRTCDWFGIDQIVCSTQSVDLYNPKVVQSTMGSVANVNVLYVDLAPFLKQIHKTHTLYICDLQGTSLYKQNFKSNAAFYFGNESHGISNTLSDLPSTRISIPKKGSAESLNLSMSCGIILSKYFELSS